MLGTRRRGDGGTHVQQVPVRDFGNFLPSEYPLLSTSLHFAAKVSKEADGASPRSGSSAAMLISGDFSATSFAAWRGGKRACQFANAGACHKFGNWQARAGARLNAGG